MNFKALYDLYFERHTKVKNRNVANTHYWWTAHGDQWKDRDVSSIKKTEVQDWVDRLGQKSQSSATRAVHMMAAIINWGIRREYVPGPNPCTGVEKFKIRSRDRFLMPEEFKRFRHSLEQESEVLRDLFWMMLLTGARKSNVLAMRWDEVDLDLAMWRFDSKNDDITVLPLNTGALAILQRRMNQRFRSPWVFPNKRKDSHVKDLKRPWKRILKRAGIKELRIHDLRRTLGSYLTIAGESEYVVGKALGHKDRRSTAVYARLPLKRVRQAVEGVQRYMQEESA